MAFPADILLRNTSHAPFTNKGSKLSFAELDRNVYELGDEILALKAERAVSTTAAALKTLVNGGLANTNATYLVTDAGAGTTGVLSSLKIRAKSASSLFSTGEGTFINPCMTTAVEAFIGYDVQTNKIKSVFEPIANNKVFAGEWGESGIATFPFDQGNFQINNTWNDFRALNFNTNDVKIGGTYFQGTNFDTLCIDLNNTTGHEFINWWHKGATNITGGAAEMTVTGNNCLFDCQTVWAGDDGIVLRDVGAGSYVSYGEIGWDSYLDFNSFNVNFRWNHVNGGCELNIGAAGNFWGTDVTNRSVIWTKGAVTYCEFNGSQMHGVIANTSEFRNCTDASDRVIAYDSSNLDNTIILNKGATGTSNITGSRLKNCTVDFANHTNCTLLNRDAFGTTITFTADNQTL